MPKRFKAGSGYIIDNENNISKQTDVIIYDSLSSPLLRANENTQIIPADTVACIIEVKSSLDKDSLQDAFQKVVSCKVLQKTPFSELDRKSTGSNLTTVETLSIVFGFESKLTLKTLAGHLKEFNKSCDSKCWPDMVVVLDRGIINYWVSYPGETNFAGEIHNQCQDGFPIPPLYIHLAAVEDGKYSLNRFFNRLLSHLTFYPKRPSTIPFDLVLQGAGKSIFPIEGYQYNLNRRLKVVPEKLHIQNEGEPPLSIEVYDEKNKQIGLIQFIPWQDGSVVRWYSSIPLQGILALVLPKLEGIVVKQPSSDAQLSSVLNISKDDFRKWPDLLKQKSNMTAKLVEPIST